MSRRPSQGDDPKVIREENVVPRACDPFRQHK